MSHDPLQGWIHKSLDELGFVGRGRSRHRPRNDPSLCGGPYPFFQTGDVKAAELYLSSYNQTYNEKGLAQSKLWEPDTLCITIAANIAETAILRIRGCFPDSIVGFTADPSTADVRFVKYAFDTMKLRMQSISRGTTQDNLSLDKLLSFEFLMPSLPTQQKIAAILSAYDDLIENNTRRIQILEEIARLIYREWFVHFRFPGHEGVRIVDSELGPIPEGWEVCRLSEAAAVHRGRSYRSVDLVPDGLPFLNLKCIERDGGFRYDGLKRYGGRYKETQEARPGDIIVAVTDMTQARRVVAQAARVPDVGEDRFVYSMDLVKIAPVEDVSQDYLYGMLRFTAFADGLKEFANGANVLHLRPVHIEQYEFPLAPRYLRDRYGALASAVHAECDILLKKNELLSRTRDLLLPRLISGEIDVSELEIETGGLD